jgi:hypothetical protein
VEDHGVAEFRQRHVVGIQIDGDPLTVEVGCIASEGTT